MSAILTDPASITVYATVALLIGTLWTAGHAKFGWEA